MRRRGFVSRRFAWLGTTLVLGAVLWPATRPRAEDSRPSIEFTRVPREDPGGTVRLDWIEGRAVGARPGQRIVLYARSGAWYVQPFADQPFTSIQTNGRWGSETHLGTEFAALLVDPEFRPAAMLSVLPAVGGGIAAIAVVPGEPNFWRTRWFQLSGLAAGLLAAFALHRYRLRELRRRLNVRFDERLADRNRLAQELYDTLLQGFMSASMQLHAAVDQMSADSPDRPRMDRVLRTMGQVVLEGRNVLHGLRSPEAEADPLEVALARVWRELAVAESIDFRVSVEGTARSVHPIIRDEAYCVGREALVNAFRHARARAVELEVQYSGRALRLLVRDDGCGMEPGALEPGREGRRGLARMRERADRIGARLRFLTRTGRGTEVELTVPSGIAFRTAAD